MGGLRVDNNSRYGLTINPRFAGMYIASPRTSVRGSIGFAYKAPPASMSWQSLAYKAGTNHDSLVYIYIPNPSLEPEKYMSLELGLIKKYKRGINLNISVYYNAIRNLIMDTALVASTLYLPLSIVKTDSSTILTKANNHDVVSQLYGLQATIKAPDLIKSVHLDAELSVTFAKSGKYP